MLRKLVRVYFQAKRFQVSQQLYVMRKFYKNRRFLLLDVALGICSLFFNPFRTSRKFNQKRGEQNLYTYGETPLDLFAELAREAKISPSDHFVELGSGRGKICFWVSLFCGCSSRGIEWVPLFVHLSRTMSTLFRLRAHFEKTSMFAADLSTATVVYLYGLHLSEEEMERLERSFEQMRSGSRVITIGEPIRSRAFSLIKKWPAAFAWGETEAFIHVKH